MTKPMNDISPIAQPDLTQAVREAAMLAYVSIGSWSATEKDDELMEDVKRQHNAEGDVGTVIKYLLSGADSHLKTLKSSYQAVRNHHYKLTLPWVNDPHAPSQKGPRLLPHLIYPRYITDISALRRQALVQLDEFLAVYPDLVVQARSRLKTMVSDGSYPTAEQLRHRFRLHVDFQPIPSSTQFSGLDDHMLERLSKNLQQKQQRQLADASRVMWQRARDRIEKLMERMTLESADDKKKFKEATLDNVRELLTMLPGWNVAGNPLVEEITHDIGRMMQGIEADQLRQDKTLRGETADAAKKIVDKMARWGL
jgi:hypothetical protein